LAARYLSVVSLMFLCACGGGGGSSGTSSSTGSGSNTNSGSASGNSPSSTGSGSTSATGTGTGSATAINSPVPPPPTSYTIGGTISGLGGGTAVLQNNGADNLTVSTNGTFTFPTASATGSSYAVSVLAQPIAQGCSITNGAGPVWGAVSNIHVSCVTPGVLALLAGNAGGYGNVDGTGAAARFDYAQGSAVDSAGNVYVADTLNDTVRKITPAGVVTTLAGTAGYAGYGDGTGAAARFNHPTGVAVDGAGTVYVADSWNHTIRKITAAGVVTTLAGKGGTSGNAVGSGADARFYNPTGLAVDGAGNVYVADSSNSAIRKITAAGVVSTLAGGYSGYLDGAGTTARFNGPSYVAVDNAGNVFVTDTWNHVVRKIDSVGVVSTVAGSAGSRGYVDGKGAAAMFDGPNGIAVDAAGHIYVADTYNQVIRKVSAGGVVTTPPLTGSGIGMAAPPWNPFGIALDGSGNIYVTGQLNQTVRKIDAAGTVTTLAGAAPVTGSADGTATAALFNNPFGVAVDGTGNVYVADTTNSTIRTISSTGVVGTLAGAAGAAGYVDGLGTTARFNSPLGVAMDSAGNAYVADTGNQVIRKVDSAGVVTTVAGMAGTAGHTDGKGTAATFNNPEGIAVDRSGNIYVAERTSSIIRKIDAANVVSTVAGVAGTSGHVDGPGTSATFSYPDGLAVDGVGNIYVADTGNHCIRRITAAAVVSTFAGACGYLGYADGTGTAAMFSYPNSVTLGSSGDIYVSDSGNSTIRKITAAGVVTTVVGTAGVVGFVGGNSLGAISYPRGLAISGSTLYTTTNNAIIEVTGMP
jgi:sugar lactone lactonase YvrE